jgi:hypothetical protein
VPGRVAKNISQPSSANSLRRAACTDTDAADLFVQQIEERLRPKVRPEGNHEVAVARLLAATTQSMASSQASASTESRVCDKSGTGGSSHLAPKSS